MWGHVYARGKAANSTRAAVARPVALGVHDGLRAVRVATAAATRRAGVAATSARRASEARAAAPDHAGCFCRCQAVVVFAAIGARLFGNPIPVLALLETMRPTALARCLALLALAYTAVRGCIRASAELDPGSVVAYLWRVAGGAARRLCVGAGARSRAVDTNWGIVGARGLVDPLVVAVTVLRYGSGATAIAERARDAVAFRACR